MQIADTNTDIYSRSFPLGRTDNRKREEACAAIRCDRLLCVCYHRLRRDFPVAVPIFYLPHLAGRDDNPRRREVYKYTKIEYEHSWKGSRDNRAVHRDYSYKQKNGNRFLSGEINSDHGKNGSYGRTEERKLVKLQTRSGADETYSKVGDPENEDQVQLPAEKRRKVSPNLLDRVENEVRIQCKNWITSVATLITPTKDETRGQELSAVSSRIHVLKNQGLEFSSDEPVSEVEYVETPLSSPASSFSSIRPNYFEENGQEKDGIEEEEVAHTRDIAMSRWASDSDPAGDICSSDDEETQKWRRGPLDLESPKQVIERYSSPESGEFQREDSDGNRVTVYDNDKGSLREADNGVVSSANDYDDTIMADVNEKHLDGLIVSEDGSEIQDKNDLEEPILPAQKSVNMLQECRSVFEYEKLNKISEGTYGIVYKAKDLKSGELVALKKVKMNIDRDGFPISSLREINIMSSFDHPSIVGVKEVVMDDLNSVFMVMEYMEYDLKKAMEVMKQPFSVSEVKLMMMQLLEGVKYLHDNWVLHRDLKTSNLLLNKDGNLKICDFGLSRQYGSPLKPYTALVVTMWYRSPELLLGTKQYSTAIDMWSVGCIMAEMLTKEPLFRGKTEIDQLDKIFRSLGTPSDSIWPGFSELPGAKSKFVQQPYNLLQKKFPATSFTGSPVLSDSGFDLLNRLLTYNPEKRISAEDALNHPWFCEVPLPKSDIKPLRG